MKTNKFYNNDWIGNDILNKLKECKIKYEYFGFLQINEEIFREFKENMKISNQ